MSKIAFFCIPAHGHTNPTLAVVKDLVDKGNEVRYYSYDVMREKIESTGARYISCDKYDIQMNLKPEDADRVGRDIAFSTEIIVNTTLALDDAILEEMREWKPNCIVADSVAYWGKLIALKLEIPFVSSTTTFAFNRYSSKLMKQSFGQILKMIFSMGKINRCIKRLNKKGYKVDNVLSIVNNDNDTETIVYTSPEFQPYTETFSEKYLFVGPSVIRRECDIKKSSKRTIYISMGTVNNQDVSFFRNCITAFKDGDVDVDVIMSVGEIINTNELGAVPKNFKVEKRVNQIEVLHRVDAFVTHCGMNSVNEALYYQVPLILYPQTSEQGAVAYRVNELGAGMYLKNNKAESIKSAVYEVIGNNRYKENAKKIAESFYRCGGASAAADKIMKIAEGNNL